MTSNSALAEVAGATGLALDGTTISGDGLSVTIESESRGKSRVVVVRYTCALAGFPAHLKLQREGILSGRAAVTGAVELITGDQDFDDAFWIATEQAPEAQAYLTDERRAYLLHHLDSCPEGGVEGSQVTGQFDFKGTGPVTARVLALQALRSGLENPEPTHLRSRGWVNLRQRKAFAHKLGLTALVLGAVLVSIDYAVEHMGAVVALGAVETVALGGAGVALWQGWGFAGTACRAALIGFPLFFLGGTGLLILQSGYIDGLTPLVFAATAGASILSYLGWLRLSRIRLGAPASANCQPAAAPMAPPALVELAKKAAAVNQPDEDWAE